MESRTLGAYARVVVLILIAVAFWWLAKYGYAKPQILAADAPTPVFSAGRAEATLAVSRSLRRRRPATRSRSLRRRP